ncbi:MAG: exonuclease domain-containing protein [Bacillota bacterium]|nr:exonuclease domain-containing protein [Bacillota bacterium]
MPKYIYDKKTSNLNVYVSTESDFPSDSDVLEILKNLDSVQTVTYFLGKSISKVLTVSGGKLLLIREAEKTLPKTPKMNFFGKISAEPVSIDEARLTGGSVVISGQLTILDSFSLKDEKVLVILGICDLTGGIGGKYFAKNAEDAAAIMSVLKLGQFVKIQGRVSYDSFDRDDSIMITKLNFIPNPFERWDNAVRKRVELHLHTNISEQDGLGSVKEHFELAKKWGHPALAITDNASTQGFIDAHAFGKSNNFKVIYGMDTYVVDDVSPFIKGIDDDYPLSGRFVVFDIETTGLSARNEQIIEIGAVKVEGNTVVDTFSSFVRYDKPLSEFTKNLTNITDDMLAGAPSIDEVFLRFADFVGDLPLVAHNADFDMSFINKLCMERNIPTFASIDTIQLARQFLPIKRYGLETLVRHLKIPFSNHHRAVADADVTASAFMYFTKLFADKGLNTVGELNAYMRENLDVKSARPSKVLVLVKSEAG